MTTTVVRRLYFYAAAFLGLQLLAAGARGLITILLEPLLSATALGRPQEATFRLSLNVALILVGLPLWVFHWYVAQRGAGAPEEQHARLRRLYGYLVLAIAVLGLLSALSTLLRALLSGTMFGGEDMQAAAAIAALVVHGAIWVYHWRIYGADRAAVEQSGGTATLRRWYLVIAQGASLAVASVAAVDLLRQLLLLALTPTIGSTLGPNRSMATLIAGLVIWLLHHLWWRRLVRVPSSLREDETRSALRQVYSALVITVSAVAALGGLTSLLYRILLAGFGGAMWQTLVADQAQAVAVILVAAPLWNYHRVQIAHEALLSDLPARTDTARRLIGYLMAAIGLGALFFGLGGLLSTLIRMALAPAALGVGWREPLSIYLALSAVALPVFSVTSRSMERLARRSAADERTLARRIYLYVALLFGISATIISLVALLRLLLGAVLGATQADLSVEIGRWTGYTLIGAAITIYYVLLVRRAGAAKSDVGAGVTIAVMVSDPLRQALLAALAREAPGATVQIMGADGSAPEAAILRAAHILIAPLQAAIDGPEAAAIRAFEGRRLLLVTALPGYDLIGARRGNEPIVRETVRVLRAILSETQSGGPSPSHNHVVAGHPGPV